MTTTQAIKLLKNGEAQLYNDVRNFELLLNVIGTIEWSKMNSYCLLLKNNDILWSDSKFHVQGIYLPIIKLSEIEQECMECVYETSADGMRTVKVAECRNCKAIKYALQMPDGKTYDIAPPKTIATIHSVIVKNPPKTLGKKFYKGTVEEKPSEDTETKKALILPNPKTISNWVYKYFTEPRPYENVTKANKETFNKIIQSLKPTPMQVTTNENGEITLSGITIDNDTVDRIVAIWKEQMSRATLDVGRWYKDKYNRLFCPTKMRNEKSCDAYGFGAATFRFIGELDDKYGWEINGSEVLATDQEVTEAIKKEAVKRGFKTGVTIQRDFRDLDQIILIDDTTYRKNEIGFKFYQEGGEQFLELNGFVIYSNGQWATIIEKPTYTHAQLEKKLGETFNYKGE